MEQKKTLNPARRLALLGMLVALALLLGWLESFVPISAALPGVKLGLANAAVLFALYALDVKSALAVSSAKVLLSALLFGGFSGLLYSSFGALLSFCVMAPLNKAKAIGAVGVSAAGGAAHIFGQLLIAVLLSSTPAVFRLAGLLILSGTLTGALTGFLTSVVLSRLKDINF